jgi:hypothetical protein
MMVALPALLFAAGCPVPAPVAGADGTAAVARAPAPAAITLNNEGKALYRQDRWREARDKYLAAQAADPEFLAPALNAACAQARLDRFAEAADEAVALVRRAFVPWGREVLEAADLAGLHVRPEMKRLRAAIAEAGPAWGRAVMPGLFFVARTRPAVKLDGQGVLVLRLNQELFAWLPATGRYRQVTADDGRVLAAVRSGDGRTVVYVRAGKLVRGPGGPPRLRGLTLRHLDVPTMALAAPVDVPGDIEELALWPAPPGALADLRVRTGGQDHHYRLVGGALVSAPAGAVQGRPAARLTGAGVADRGQVAAPAPCAFQAADEARAGQAPRVRVTAGKQSSVLDAPLGAGLAGLPFP